MPVDHFATSEALLVDYVKKDVFPCLAKYTCYYQYVIQFTGSQLRDLVAHIFQKAVIMLSNKLASFFTPGLYE